MKQLPYFDWNAVEVAENAEEAVEKINVFVKPSAEAELVRIMPRQENDCRKTNTLMMVRRKQTDSPPPAG